MKLGRREAAILLAATVAGQGRVPDSSTPVNGWFDVNLDRISGITVQRLGRVVTITCQELWDAISEQTNVPRNEGRFR